MNRRFHGTRIRLDDQPRKVKKTAQVEAGLGRPENQLASPDGGQLVWARANPSENLHRYGGLVSQRHARSSHPLSTHPQPRRQVQDPCAAMHRPVGYPRPILDLVRPSLASRCDLSGSGHPYGCRTPAPMVTESHRPHHTHFDGLVLMGDFVNPSIPKDWSLAHLTGCLVCQVAAEICECYRCGAQQYLGSVGFLQVYIGRRYAIIPPGFTQTSV